MTPPAPPIGRPRGGPRSRITEDEKTRVIELVANGSTVKGAAEAVGLTDRTVHRETHRDRAFWDAMARAIADGATKRRGARRRSTESAAS